MQALAENRTLKKIIRPSLYFVLMLLISTSSFADRGLKIDSGSHTKSTKRIALVIGNGAYQNNPLKNPPNDANDIAEELNKLNFSVVKLINANQSQMRKAIRTFGNTLKKGGVGLFFYAGHGMQVRGVNYLIPTETDIQEEDEVLDYAVNAGMVLRKMESADNRLNMVFIDACRNNPFARSFRSSQRGLAQMDAPSGSMISYATAPGKVAADGKGRNGTFTKNLIRQLRGSSDVELGQLMKRVGRGVQNDTGKKQVPWVVTSITGDFYFTDNHQKSKSIAEQPNAQTTKFFHKRDVLVDNNKHYVYVDGDGKVLTITMEAVSDFTNNLVGKFPQVDFASFDLDFNNNGTLDTLIDVSFGSYTKNHISYLCAQKLHTATSSTPCGAFKSKGSYNEAFITTKKQSRFHPVYTYKIPYEELSEKQILASFRFEIYSAGRGYTRYPNQRGESFSANLKCLLPK